MKRLLLPSILFLLAVASGFSQNAPKMFNYQAVARDVTGEFLADKTVSVKITITDLSNNTYTETHNNIPTNKYGLFSIKIGGGSSSNPNSTLSMINWAGGNTNIKVEINLGTGFVSIGDAQLLSVPYALYSNIAGTVATEVGRAGKNILGGTGIAIDSATAGTLTINSTIDHTKYIKLDANPSANGNYLLVWDGIKWATQVISPTGSTQNVADGGIVVNGSKIGAKVDGITIDTVKGFLRVRRPKLDSLDLSLRTGEKENFILKVKEGKLRLVADSAIQYKSKSLQIDGDTIGLKKGSTKGDVLTWNGDAWKPTPSAGNGWSLSGNIGTKAGENYIGSNDAIGFKIKTDNKTRMTFDATGNVVLGTLNPIDTNKVRAAFEQRGKYNGVSAIFGGEGTGVSLSSAAIGFNQYFSNNSNLSISKGYGGSISLDPSSGSMKFGISKNPAISADETYTSNTMVTLTKEGKVGINTIAPKRFLEVNNGILVDSFQLSTLKDVTDYVLTSDADGNGTWQASKGSLPNAVTNQTLFYTGTEWDTTSFLSNTGTSVTVGNGASKGKNVLTVNGRIKTENITESSDSRYKTDVNKLENVLTKVNAINGVSYFWKSDSLKTKKDIGVIAQELEKVFPELVDTDEAGYKSVRYSHLVPVLIEAIKEQQKQIESLKSEISAKENKAHNNESRIQSLETSIHSMNIQMQLLLELVGKNEGIKASK